MVLRELEVSKLVIDPGVREPDGDAQLLPAPEHAHGGTSARAVQGFREPPPVGVRRRANVPPGFADIPGLHEVVSFPRGVVQRLLKVKVKRVSVGKTPGVVPQVPLDARFVDLERSSPGDVRRGLLSV